MSHSTGKPLSAAQQAQVDNRDRSGQWQEKISTAPGAGAQLQPVTVEDVHDLTEELDDLDDWGATEGSLDTDSFDSETWSEDDSHYDGYGHDSSFEDDDDSDDAAQQAALDKLLAQEGDEDDVDIVVDLAAVVSDDDTEDPYATSAGDTSDFDDILAELAEEQNGPAAPMTEEDVLRILEETKRAARYANRSMGTSRRTPVMSEEDIASELTEVVLVAVKNGLTIRNRGAWLNTAALRIAAQAGGTVHRADRAAHKLWTSKVDEAEKALGRHLTQRQKDAIENAIVENWPKHRKQQLKHGFVARATVEQRMQSMDAPSENGSETRMYPVDHRSPDAIVAGEIEDGTLAPGSAAARALAAADGNGSFDRRERMYLSYEALAEVRGAPAAVAGALSSNKAIAVRKAVRGYTVTTGEMKNGKPVVLEGIPAALHTWDQGETDAGTEAFFAPWPGIDEGQRDEVAAIMRRYPDKAQDLWEAAVRNAAPSRRAADKKAS